MVLMNEPYYNYLEDDSYKMIQIYITHQKGSN